MLASYTMATSSPDNIKQWKFPDGNFIQNLSGHIAIINTLSLNQDNVLVSGGKQSSVGFCVTFAIFPPLLLHLLNAFFSS